MNDELYMMNDAACGGGLMISVVSLFSAINQLSYAEAFSLFSHRPGSQKQ